MTNPLEPNFNPGGLPDRYDNRDYKWDEVGGANAIPFDWNVGYDVEEELSVRLGIPNFKLTVKDQDGSYSCGGQAWSYYAEVMEALATGTYEPRSAKYMYAQTYVPTGGSRGRDNADIFVNQGVAREVVLTSYDHGQPPGEPFMQRSIDITDVARTDAKLSQATAYAQTGTDIETIAQALKKNHGGVLGVDGENNGSWQSEFPQPPSVMVWRHWLYAFAAKLINGKKHIGVINSWGQGVGVNGRQWLSIDYFNTAHVFSGWTHVFAPPPPQVFKHNFKVNMKFNDKNDEVTALQTALKIEGLFPVNVPATGLYGDITRRAVLDFQNKYKIIATPVDSDYGKIVGPKTRAKLNSIYDSNN